MVRMWRHLHLLKRGGRAHDPTGAQGTAPGELAVLCPACPHPNINLPPDWRSAPKESECVPNSILLSGVLTPLQVSLLSGLRYRRVFSF